jgi:hypothetical protein
MSTDQLIRITVCARRNPELSEEEFNNHWANKHGPLITSWLRQHNCVRYIQVHYHLFLHIIVPVLFYCRSILRLAANA